MAKTIRIVVEGKVQGVFYRQSTREKAMALGVTGTVRNMPDGSVEIIAAGDARQLEELTRWCNQGPARAAVTKVTATPLPLQSFKNFIVIR